MDIKLEAAICVAELLVDAVILGEYCPDCAAPLLQVPKQGMPFCGVCVAKKVKAMRDQEILHVVRAINYLANPAPERTIKEVGFGPTIDYKPYTPKRAA
jgi:uncharacterized Zn finger protein (UPF0148 family)